MDVDRSLDDMITEKRGNKTPSQPRKSAPRTSTGNERRANNTPYTRPPSRSTEDKWVHDAYQGPAGGRGRGNGPNPAIVGTGAVFTGVSTRIEVIGLHYEVTPADLKNIFSQAGTLVQGPTIRYDRSGRSKGEATMEFASPQQAKIAINKFDGAMTKGQTISIRLLPPIVAKAGRPGAPSGGSAGAGAGGAATGQSLLARIQGGNAPAAQNARGGRGGRGGPVRGRGAPAGRGGGGAARAPRRGPTNEGDLDKELDSFMNKDATNAGDVDMA
ncbi:hypothetical protein CI109_104310 [Kwoniella shandongensis]|uniref:Uncharacterized protein n=1 Tax=Kwoniella shandongensis TaxID=1734106 RepID=A0A5M6C0V4_9TREE|nr:uncharacterized protein CI109_002787 [Kwoniella shandongensis]KAA5528633.1 hypothetical protein CI109_002787 [Kwoniella shandongensis]